jgi:hypothetical protein
MRRERARRSENTVLADRRAAGETMVFGIHDGAHPLRAVINFEVETWLSPRTE